LRRLLAVAAPGDLRLGAPLVASRARAAPPSARLPPGRRAARPADRARPRAAAAAARTASVLGRPGGGAARRRWRRQIHLQRGALALDRRALRGHHRPLGPPATVAHDTPGRRPVESAARTRPYARDQRARSAAPRVHRTRSLSPLRTRSAL